MTTHNHDHAHALHAAPSHDGHAHHFVAANKAYYDEHAQKLEQMYPQWREMSGKQVEAFRAEWPELFDKERTAVMDFACGIGASTSSPRRGLCLFIDHMPLPCSHCRTHLRGPFQVREEHRRCGYQSGLH